MSFLFQFFEEIINRIKAEKQNAASGVTTEGPELSQGRQWPPGKSLEPKLHCSADSTSCFLVVLCNKSMYYLPQEVET